MPKIYRLSSDNIADESEKKKEFDIIQHRRLYGKRDGAEAAKLLRKLANLLAGSANARDRSYSGGSLGGTKNGRYSFGVFSSRAMRRSVQRRAGGGGFKQRCTVKFSYEPASLDKHLRFLEEYLKQKNKKNVEEKPELFTENEERASLTTLQEYKSRAMPKFFRLMLSPENQSVPTMDFVRVLMKRIEKVTGYRLDWVAAVHNDTAHRHAHVVINGIDRNGCDVRFPPQFVRETVRLMAMDVCTEMVGRRTKEEIEAERMKLPLARRYCRLDDGIKKVERTRAFGADVYQSSVVPEDELMRQRLNFLSELGFAKRGDDGAFMLEKDWDGKLRAIGRYNSFLRARNEMRFVSGTELGLYESSVGEITGIVTRIYRINWEDSWTNALVIENKAQGKAWYVPVSPRKEPSEKLLNATVSFKTERKEAGKMRLAPNLHVLQWAPDVSKGKEVKRT